MAVTETARLGLTRWSDAATDPLSMTQMDTSHRRLEERAVMFTRGTMTNRPAAGVLARVYEVTGDASAANNGRVFYDTGAAWQEVALLNGPEASRTFVGPVTAHGGVVTRYPDPGGAADFTALPSAYPLGVSLSSASGGEVGSPTGQALSVWTIKFSNTNVVQYATQRSSALTQTMLYQRIGYVGGPDGDAWSPWQSISRLLDAGTEAAPALAFAGDSDTGLHNYSPNHVQIVLGGVAAYQFGNHLIPGADNLRQLGQSARRWSSVWSATGTIQTSDRDAKEDVEPVDGAAATDRVLRVADEATIRFRWPDGTRRHVGFDAEAVGAVHGDDTAAYIDPAFEADARENPWKGQAPAAWLDEQEAAGADREDARQEWRANREAFDAETEAIRSSAKGIRAGQMIPDLYAALAAALRRIDALEEQLADGGG